MAVQRRTRAILEVTGSVLASLLLIAGCGGSGSDDGPDAERQPTSAREQDDGLILIADQDPGSWDITTVGLAALWQWIPGNVLEPLVTFDESGEAQPKLAESWTISPDRTQYTFTLREGVTFHSGSPLTAADAAFSLERYWKSENASRSGPLQAIESITAPDERTLQVTLSHPSQWFWREMGGIGGTVFEAASYAGIAQKPVGTGPFELTEYQADDHVTFTASSGYWGEAPAIKNVEVRFITDGGAALNALSSGEADGYPLVAQQLWERVKSDGFDQSYVLELDGAGGQVTYAAINSREAPFDDQELRQALARSIDRSLYAQALGADWAVEPTCVFATSEKPYFTPGDDGCALPYDVEASKEGLDDAGQSELTLSYLPNDGISDILAAQLEGAGLTVEREQLELARYQQLILAGSPPQFEMTEINTPRDIWQFLCPDEAKMNWHSFCDRDMTAALQRADQAATADEANTHLAEAATVLQEKAVIIPILATKKVSLIHPDLTGWSDPQVYMEVNLAALAWK